MSMNDDIKNILVSEEALKAKVAELGAQISRDYEGRNLVLVSILKGSVVFMADLMRAVTIPCSIDFMVVSSYGGSNTTTSGLVKIIKDLDSDLSGKAVFGQNFNYLTCQIVITTHNTNNIIRHFSIQRFFPIFRNENYMVLAFPAGM